LSATVLDSAGALSAAVSALRFRLPFSIARTDAFSPSDVDTRGFSWVSLQIKCNSELKQPRRIDLDIR
jgi:hypothetical protein